MTSSNIIKTYEMQKVNDGGDIYYKRVFEEDGKLVTLTLHKMELINECYFVRQVFYKHKLNPKTQLYGVLGKAHMTFGIKNTTFKNRNLDDVEEFAL